MRVLIGLSLCPPANKQALVSDPFAWRYWHRHELVHPTVAGERRRSFSRQRHYIVTTVCSLPSRPCKTRSESSFPSRRVFPCMVTSHISRRLPRSYSTPFDALQWSYGGVRLLMSKVAL